MKFEKKIKKDLTSTFEVKDQYQEVVKKIDFTKKVKEDNYMKRGILILTTVLLVSVIGSISYFGLTKYDTSPVSLVSVDVNPSIQFALDKKNKVVSVSGENNEGKMIIAGENLVGKDFSEALNVVFEVESETGYLNQFTLTQNDGVINFTLTCDIESLQSQIEESITSSLNTLKDKLNYENIKSTINEFTNDQLQTYLISNNSAYTKEELSSFDTKQLIALISLNHIETLEFYSTEIEELYFDTKNYQIRLSEEEFTRDLIANMGVAYQIVVSGYDIFLNSMKKGIEEINQFKYDYLLDENSDYQKALNKVQERKMEVISLRNEISKLQEQGQNVDLYLITLETKIALLNDAVTLLNETRDFITSSIDAIVSRIQNAYNTFVEIRQTLISQEEFEQLLLDHTKELDSKINETKNKFFTTFEETHKDDITRIKNQVLNYKEELKKIVENR